MTLLRRGLLGCLIVPALVAGTMTAVRAQTAEQAQIPSVTVHPVGTSESDPNGGQWFVTTLEPEQTRSLQVRLYNPAAVAQTVKLYLADMTFDAAGVPEVTNVPTDVGTWGAFENPTVTIASRETQIQTFTITAPRGVDPGDHVGAVVVEHPPEGDGNVRSIKRVAVRLYASLPGDARRDFAIDAVTAKKDSAFMTRELTVTVQLRNTGRIRLEPTVQVDGVSAKGPQLLMSSAVERYVVTRPVRFWGGPVRLRVDAQSRSLGVAGPVRQVRVTVWVIPWHLLFLLALIAAMVFAGRKLLRGRGRKYREIQTDIRRIERLVSQQIQAPRVVEPANDPSTIDADAAIRAAIKQARRAGDEVTALRLERALAERTATQPAETGTHQV